RRAEPAHRHGLRHGDAADRIGFNFINRGVGGERREQCGGRKARRIEPVPAGATERLEPNAVCRSRNPGEIRARRHLLELDQNTLGDYRQTTDHFLAHGGLERARLRAQTTREECKRQEEKERRGEERRGEERTERFSFWPSPFTQTSEWGGPLSAAEYQSCWWVSNPPRRRRRHRLLKAAGAGYTTEHMRQLVSTQIFRRQRLTAGHLDALLKAGVQGVELFCARPSF